MARATYFFLFFGMLLLGPWGCNPDGPGDEAALFSGELQAPPAPPALTLSPEAFRSAGPLLVVAARPNGPVEGDVRPTITFSRPVVSLGTIEPAGGPVAGKPAGAPGGQVGTVSGTAATGRGAVAVLTPAVAGSWRWLGSASLEFIPTQPLPYATTFSVEVAAGLTALDGSRLAEPYRFQFSTPPPVIHSAGTLEERSWATPDQRFKLVLNQPVKDLDAAARVMVNGQPLPLKVVREVNVAEEERARRAKEEAEARAKRGEPEPPPAVEPEERTYRNRITRYELQAASPLPLASVVTLVVEPTLAGREGPLTLGKRAEYTYRTYGPLQLEAVRGCFYSYAEEDCSGGSLGLRTTNLVDVASLKGRLTLEPAVEINWEEVEAQVVPSGPWSKEPYAVVDLAGKYQAGTSYTVTVAPGVTDRFGQTAGSFTGSFRYADRQPFFTLGSGIGLLEAGGYGTLPVTSLNVTSGEAQIWVLTPEEMTRLLAWRSSNGWVGEGAKRRRVPQPVPAAAPLQLTLDLQGPRNVSHASPINLRQALPAGQTGGLFLVRASTPEIKDRSGNPAQDEVLAQVTDLAVHAKLGATSGVLWVTSLGRGTPVAGAQLELLDRAGRPVWKGVSDGAGLARTPGLEELSDEPVSSWDLPELVAVARSGADVGLTLSTWNEGFYPYDFSLESDWDGRNPRSLGLVFTDRGIYRPGEKVYVKGLVRARQLGQIVRPPAGTPVILTVHDADGEKLTRLELQLNDYGTYMAQFDLPADAGLGGYSVEAVTRFDGDELRAYGSFRVEEYRAPQFQVDVSSPAKEAVAGETLTGRVLARYLFGGPMAGARVQWNATRSTTEPSLPGNPGFVFGQQTWWWDDEQPSDSSSLSAGGSGTCDAQGGFALQVGRADAPGGRTCEYVVEAAVTDVNRQQVAGRTRILVHPAALYAGVRPVQDGFGELGKPLNVELIAVRPDGQRVAGAPLKLAVLRRDWKSIREQDEDGQWITRSEPQETPVAECAVTSAATPAQCSFTPAQPGLHVLAATVTDPQQRQQTSRSMLYVVGDGWVAWQRDDSARVDLVADKTTYNPGETARILVKSPVPQAEALLTVEREGVTRTTRVKLTSAAQSFSIPIDEALVPNVFVGVIIVRGRVPDSSGGEGDPGRPQVWMGYTQLKVEKRSRRLTVAVTPDAVEKQPRDPVVVRVRSTDHQGRPAPAEVTVWAVDEAVLRLTSFQLPDLVEAIHPPRGLSVRIAEPMIHLVRALKYDEKGEPGGSGGVDATGSGFRSKFLTTVLFERVETDRQGQGEVRFTLPDNLTTYRIMAVAVTPEDRFGGGEAKVVVSKPLLALPALPRLARVGDRFEAGVVLHTKGQQAAGGAGGLEAKVRVQPAAGLELEGAAEQQVTLVQGGPAREVRFRFTATQPTTVPLRFTVEGGGFQDGLEQQLPVKLAVQPEAVAAYGDTQERRQEGLVPPGGVRNDFGGLQITLTSTLLGGYQESMQQLVEYPYGCLEQLSSRLVPFVAYNEIRQRFGLPDQTGTPADAAARQEADQRTAAFGMASLDLTSATAAAGVVKATVRAMENLQNEDGGFRYWSSSSCSDEWASSYAVLALARAKAAGFEVDPEVIKAGQKFLSGTVAAGRCLNCGWGCRPPSDTTQVFALYALARSGAPHPSFYGALFARRQQLPLFAQAMLADALAVGQGDRSQAEQLLTELLNHAKETAGELHFAETDAQSYASYWSSDVRTSALVLQTLTDLAPEHPYVAKLARYLDRARQQDGRFRNTQEAAFTLMAMVELMKSKEAEPPAFTGKVTLGGRELAAAPFQGRTLQPFTARLTMPELSLGRDPLPLVFERAGAAGTLYYTALLKYAPAELPTTPLERGLVVQRWFEPFTGGGQTRRFLAGDLVRVRLRVATSQERNHVVVEVPLPSGLEAVDVNLATTARLVGGGAGLEVGTSYHVENLEDYGEESEDDELGLYAHEFYDPFNHTELRDDRVLLFADRLPPGLHLATFIARATTIGDFVLPPARAEEMYAPEVFGRSDGGRFLVVEAPELAVR